MKIIIFFGFVFVLCSFQCEQDIVNDSRSVISGRVVNQNNSPLSDIAIEVVTDSKIIGAATTNGEGLFGFTSLRSNNQDFFFIVNKSFAYGYTSVSYVYGDSSFQENYNFEDVELRKKAFLSIRITNTNPGQNMFSYILEYTSSDCNFYFVNTTEPNSEFCYQQQTLQEELQGNQSEYILEIESILNSEIVFTYQINSGTPQTSTIILSEETNNYEIEY